MSEPETFLSRWARRKREAVEESRDSPPQSSPPRSAPAEITSNDGEQKFADRPHTDPSGTAISTMPIISTMPMLPTIDLSSLPAIESITAATDLRPFLVPGIPAELTRAALRRAWLVDPKIRDFVGIAENQWDFTAADGMTGFGPLGPLDDVRRLVAQIMGDSEVSGTEAVGGENLPKANESRASRKDDITANDASIAPTAGADEKKSADDASKTGILRRNKVDVAMQQNEPKPEYDEPPAKRGHGGALPK